MNAPKAAYLPQRRKNDGLVTLRSGVSDIEFFIEITYIILGFSLKHRHLSDYSLQSSDMLSTINMDFRPMHVL